MTQRPPSARGPRRSPARLLPALLLLFCLLLLAAMPGTAAARTLAVPDEHRTIAAAMAAAEAGDIILVGCGTYHEHDIAVTPGVQLWSGTLQPECVVIDAGGLGRVLVFAGGDSTTSVVGFTLRGGRVDGDGGAILCRDGSPRLARLHILENQARRGGGLAVVGDAAPVLVDCVIAGNVADLHGGGLYWHGDRDGRLERCTIERNRALGGGGLALAGSARLELRQVVLSGNEAAGSGGAAWVDGASLLAHECVLVANDGGLAGGAVATRNGRAHLIACTVADNSVDVTGGGLLVTGGALRLERTILAFNRGGALHGDGIGDLRVSASNVYGHDGGD